MQFKDKRIVALSQGDASNKPVQVQSARRPASKDEVSHTWIVTDISYQSDRPQDLQVSPWESLMTPRSRPPSQEGTRTKPPLSPLKPFIKDDVWSPDALKHIKFPARFQTLSSRPNTVSTLESLEENPDMLESYFAS